MWEKVERSSARIGQAFSLLSIGEVLGKRIVASWPRGYDAVAILHAGVDDICLEVLKLARSSCVCREHG